MHTAQFPYLQIFREIDDITFINDLSFSVKSFNLLKDFFYVKLIEKLISGQIDDFFREIEVNVTSNLTEIFILQLPLKYGYTSTTVDV